MRLLCGMALGQALLLACVSVLAYQLTGLFISDTFDSRSVQGKNVVITGASSGIGEELAYQYTSYGANVFITARREHRLKQVIEKCKQIAKPEQKLAFLAADMAKPGSREKLINAAVHFFGDIDQLILNHVRQPLVSKWTGTRQQTEDLQAMLNVNLVSYAHLAAEAMPSLRKTSGSICVIGSASGRMPTPFTLDYAASKFALDGFFSGLRYEFKATNENVSITHCVLGLISTEAGSSSFEKVKAMMTSPNHFILNMFKPAALDDTAQAIISATTQRLGELYFPSYQMLWFLSVIRSIMPEIEKYDPLGFTGS